MADTLSLDAAVQFIVGRGGSVRLIGDDQQLAAIGAGGVLRDIENSHGAVRLTELHRFTRPRRSGRIAGVTRRQAGGVGLLPRPATHPRRRPGRTHRKPVRRMASRPEPWTGLDHARPNPRPGRGAQPASPRPPPGVCTGIWTGGRAWRTETGPVPAS